MPNVKTSPSKGKVTLAILFLLCLTSCQRFMESNESLLERGVEHVNGGRIQEGIGLINKVLKRDPKHAVALCTRGIAYTQLGKYEEALADLDKCIPAQAALKNRAWVYLMTQRYDDAIADARQLMAFESEQLDALTLMARCYSAQKDFENAATNYKRVSELEPDNEAALFSYGGMLVELGRYDEAITAFTQGIALSPTDYTGFALRANARRLAGDMRGAEEDRQAANRWKQASEDASVKSTIKRVLK